MQVCKSRIMKSVSDVSCVGLIGNTNDAVKYRPKSESCRQNLQVRTIKIGHELTLCNVFRLTFFM